MLSIFHSVLQQNLEIHKKMAMSDEQLEAYERKEREVCVCVCCCFLLGFSALHAICLPFHQATYGTVEKLLEIDINFDNSSLHLFLCRLLLLIDRQKLRYRGVHHTLN